MDSGLKQRLIGAAVLVALAVIFLPMLVQGPAPDSGVADLPLQMPDAPEGDYETRDLPLVAPSAAPGASITGGDGERLPTVDTAESAAAGTADPADAADLATAAPADAAAVAAPASQSEDAPMLPAAVAGGDYAVSFGSYGSRANADAVVARLREAKLSGYREQIDLDGKPVYRVRVGPYATRADAEAARIAAARINPRAGATVIALDAEAAATPPRTTAQAPAKAPASTPKTSTPPATTPSQPAPPQPASAAKTGFAVQLGAFGNAAQAAKKRDELRAAGFTAFTETVNTDKGTLTRVLAGPVVTRADADALRAQLRAKTGSDGLVRAHP